MEYPVPVKEEECYEEATAKRARKRSRYLSSPYTDDVSAAAATHTHTSSRSEEELMANVAVPDMLSALRAAALLDADAFAANAAAGEEVLRCFFTLHRNSSTRVTAEAELTPSSSSSSQKKEATTTTTGFALKKKKKKKKNNAASTPTTTTRRLPLTDVRNNLEKMISSLQGCSPMALRLPLAMATSVEQSLRERCDAFWPKLIRCSMHIATKLSYKPVTKAS
uniref:Uncharacterized protein n=1 Tax=Oryza brachyantha TaxID=4533 RepID=J3M338_ORYBR